MRIRTDGDYAHRKDVIEEAADVLDENTNTAAVIAACDHARQDVKAKRDALEYLARHVSPDVAAEVADRLSTSAVSLEYSPPEASVEVES